MKSKFFYYLFSNFSTLSIFIFSILLYFGNSIENKSLNVATNFKNMEKLSFDLYEISLVYVGVREGVRKELISSAIENAGGKSKLIEKLSKIYRNKSKRSLYNVFYSQEISSEILRELEKIACFDHEKILESVEYYRKGKVKIYPFYEGTRKLPINHDLYFEYLCGLVRSSSVTSGGRGMKELPGRKAILVGKKVFGEFDYRESFYGPERKYIQIILPKILGDIIDYVHPFPSLTEPTENIIAFLSGILSYKGSVGVNWINVSKKNYLFLENLKPYFEVLGCDAKILKGKTQYHLRISKTSFLKLLNMIEKLPKDLQLFDYQNRLIQARFERPKAKPSSFLQRTEQILKSLGEKPKTMWEIASDVGIAYSSIYRYIQNLLDKNIIKVVERKKVKKTYAIVYGLADL